jgi:hypothetical protein
MRQPQNYLGMAFSRDPLMMLQSRGRTQKNHNRLGDSSCNICKAYLRPRSGRHGRRNHVLLLSMAAIGLALAIIVPALAGTSTPTALGLQPMNSRKSRSTAFPSMRLCSRRVCGRPRASVWISNITDTPRSAAWLSSAQPETVNSSDPRAISFFTSSTCPDSSHGTVAVPLIRTQIGDVYCHDIRNSLNSGCGAPVNFDSLADMARVRAHLALRPANLNGSCECI